MKIVGCGLRKTATTSLRDALVILGYRVKSSNRRLATDWNQGRLWRIRAVAHIYPAMRNVPWNLAFRELDAWFPDSRFILTVRDPDDWYASVIRHYHGTQEDEERTRVLFGFTDLEARKDDCIDRYLSHNQAVRDHFAESLLEVDFTDGDGWDELCDFLDVETPRVPFPHSNQSSP